MPKQNAQAWLKYLRGQYPTVAFKSSTQNQNERLSQSSVSFLQIFWNLTSDNKYSTFYLKVPVEKAKQNLLTSSQCLGADILVKLLNNYTRVNDLKQTITVGIIGLKYEYELSFFSGHDFWYIYKIGKVCQMSAKVVWLTV